MATIVIWTCVGILVGCGIGYYAACRDHAKVWR